MSEDVATGAMFGSTGLKAMGAIQQGQAGYATGKYNSRVAEINAQNIERDGVAQESEVRDQARLAMGEQVAAQGGSGLELGTGSALAALRESAINAELDRMTLRRKSAAAAGAERAQGALALAQGKFARTAGYYAAASAVVDGASRAATAGA